MKARFPEWPLAVDKLPTKGPLGVALFLAQPHSHDNFSVGFALSSLSNKWDVTRNKYPCGTKARLVSKKRRRLFQVQYIYEWIPLLTSFRNHVKIIRNSAKPI